MPVYLSKLTPRVQRAAVLGSDVPAGTSASDNLGDTTALRWCILRSF